MVPVFDTLLRRFESRFGAREREGRGVQEWRERLTVSLYDKVWFGTEVWVVDGHDILRAYRVWGSVRSVIKS